ncbi:MAG: hypothetical protein K8I65_16270 [Thermoanaerobaculia bacterium]|nr:hypothetical protein [Thermoanaerobaculia bacterium]
MVRRTVLLIAACFALAVGAPPSGAAEPAALPPLEELVRALDAPTVAGRLPAPEVLRVGRAEIRPGAGSYLLVLEAGGRRCGWILAGPSRLVYRVDDRFSIPVVRRNLKQMPGLTAREEGSALLLETALRGAAVWGWGEGETDLQARELQPVAASTIPDWVREALDKSLDDNPARDVAQDAFNGPAGYRWALLRGPGDDYVLDVDPRPSVATEWLSHWRSIPINSGPFSGRLYSESVATQPIGRDWWVGRAPEFETTDTKIRAVQGDGELLTVEAAVRIRVTRGDLRLLSLSLVHHVYDDRLRRFDNRITKLTVDGQPAAFHHFEDDALEVVLARPLAVGQSVLLEVTSSGELLQRPYGDSYWRLGNEAWYPRPSIGIGREMSSFDIDAEVRAPFLPFAPGTIVSRTTTATGNRVVTRLAGPMESAFLMAGKYSLSEHDFAERRVRIATYAAVKKHEAERVAGVVAATQSCLERWLGVPYPFPDLQLVEINSWGWAQAPPGLIFVTADAFLNSAVARSGVDVTHGDSDLVWGTRGINERIAHEVAHGWFPHVAKVDFLEENWLSESFADYTSAFCLSGFDDKKAKYFWKRQLRDWKSAASKVEGGTSIFLARHGNDKDGAISSRYYLLYGKGPLVLHALRQELGRQAGSSEEGDRLFMTWIRSYVKNFTYETGETRHLVAILEQMTGKPWQPWFERYVYGTETPAVD